MERELSWERRSGREREKKGRRIKVDVVEMIDGQWNGEGKSQNGVSTKPAMPFNRFMRNMTEICTRNSNIYIQKLLAGSRSGRLGCWRGGGFSRLACIRSAYECGGTRPRGLGQHAVHWLGRERLARVRRQLLCQLGVAPLERELVGQEAFVVTRRRAVGEHADALVDHLRRHACDGGDVQRQVALGVPLRGELGPAAQELQLLLLLRTPCCKGDVQVVAMAVAHPLEHSGYPQMTLQLRDVQRCASRLVHPFQTIHEGQCTRYHHGSTNSGRCRVVNGQVASLVSLSGQFSVKQQPQLTLLRLRAFNHRPVQSVLAHGRLDFALHLGHRPSAECLTRIDRLRRFSGVRGRGGGLLVVPWGTSQERADAIVGLLLHGWRRAAGWPRRVLSVVLWAARLRRRQVLLKRDWTSHAADLGDQVAKRIIWNDIAVGERSVRARRRLPSQKPLRDCGALIGMAISTHNRILHDLLGNWANGSREFCRIERHGNYRGLCE
mmetsp:Transcript_17254/g.33694  ORF Transcript_17254/g.33694 Transcript_17254/m.33694 type:complete len:494 (-) Transcript_17254:452-1933(-)